jgi:uncharacterized protein (UPF0218 family)
MLSLPIELREELKDPIGTLFEEPEELLAGAGDPLIAVGDVVTFHLRRAGRDPDVSVIDGLTEREEVSEEVAAVLEGDDPRVRVENPAGELSEPLLRGLVEAISREEPVVVSVDGEEDLATLPAIVTAPFGSSVVYGQPGVGMVHVTVDAQTRAFARNFIERMDGDSEAALSLLTESADK